MLGGHRTLHIEDLLLSTIHKIVIQVLSLSSSVIGARENALASHGLREPYSTSRFSCRQASIKKVNRAVTPVVIRVARVSTKRELQVVYQGLFYSES